MGVEGGCGLFMSVDVGRWMAGGRGGVAFAATLQGGRFSVSFLRGWSVLRPFWMQSMLSSGKATRALLRLDYR